MYNAKCFIHIRTIVISIINLIINYINSGICSRENTSIFSSDIEHAPPQPDAESSFPECDSDNHNNNDLVNDMWHDTKPADLLEVKIKEEPPEAVKNDDNDDSTEESISVFKKELDMYSNKIKSELESPLAGDTNRCCKLCGRMNESSITSNGCKVPCVCIRDLCEQAFLKKVANNADDQSLKGSLKTFKCTFCEEAFTQKVDLLDHLVLHSEEKPNQCSVCGLSFADRMDLKKHCSVHAGRLQTECIYCGKILSDRSNLNKHLLIHTGERPFKCHVCGNSFRQNIALTRHLTVHYGQERVDCAICQKSFSSKDTLARHITKHYGLKPHKCSICNKSFRERSYLVHHIIRHNRKESLMRQGLYFDGRGRSRRSKKKEPTSPVESEDIETLVESDNVEASVESCDVGIPIKSDNGASVESTDASMHAVFGETLSSGRLVTEYIQNESSSVFDMLCIPVKSEPQSPGTREEEIVVIPDVNLELKNKSDLCLNMARESSLKTEIASEEEETIKITDMTHSEEILVKPEINDLSMLECNIDDITIYGNHERSSKKNTAAQNDSKEKFHNEGDDDSGPCPICGLSRSPEDIANKDIATCVCGKLPILRPVIERGVGPTTKSPAKRPWKCELCEKDYTKKAHLQAHMLSHTGERPYSCVICGKTFREKSKCKKHQVMHIDETPTTPEVFLNPHTCDICGKVFKHKGKLARHLMVHSNVRVHPCQICGKFFKHKSSLTKHVLLHYGQRPFKCSVCGWTFIQKQYLDNHVLRHTTQIQKLKMLYGGTSRPEQVTVSSDSECNMKDSSIDSMKDKGNNDDPLEVQYQHKVMNDLEQYNNVFIKEESPQFPGIS